MTRRAARTDANQTAIVKALRSFPGITVHSTAMVGDGFPDIVVGYADRAYLFELKDPDKPPSARRLTPAEKKFAGLWTGHWQEAHTVGDILMAIGHPAAQEWEAANQ